MIAQKSTSNGSNHPKEWLQSSMRRNHRKKFKIQQSTTVMVKQCHCSGRKTMMIYGDNTITQKINSNVRRNTNKWLHPYKRRNHTKIQNITINNGDVKWCHFDWIKTIMIHSNNLVDQQRNLQCNQRNQRVFALIHGEESQKIFKI